MSQSTRSFELCKTTSETFATKQFYIAQMDSSGDAELGEGATDLLLGVMQNTPASGEEGTIRFLGTSKVIASAAILVGANLTSDSAGKAVTTTTDKDVVIGVALEAAGAAGDIIEIMLTRFTLSA